ncbi:MAG TPA: hypothetical protein PKV41_04410 [Candidatus Omnitrophota bacterium]|nr:hypothetical protein [Candidatus Omnitrophota bacterium]
MTKKFLALTICVLLLSSCTLYHVTSVEQTDAYYPAKASVDDVVYLKEIDREDYTVIGTVTVNGERRQRSFDEVILKMRREAALIGGDAITNIQTDATGVWKKLPAQDILKNAYVRANFSASVVIFGDPQARNLLLSEPTAEEPSVGTSEPLETIPVPVTEDSE